MANSQFRAELTIRLFLLTIAQNPGKTRQTPRQTQNFDPKNPYLCAELHFLLAIDPASVLEQKANIRPLSVPQNSCPTPLISASNTKTAHARSKTTR